MNKKNMTLAQHFAELRRRILVTLAVFGLAFVAGWWAAPWLQDFLTSPLMGVWPNGALLYTGLTDGLMIRLALSGLVAIAAAVPVGLYQAWAFAAPGLTRRERAFIWPVMVVSPLLFIAGAAFAFWVLFPFAFRFFIELNTSGGAPTIMMPAARGYMLFAIRMLAVFGAAFQLPLVLVLLNRVGVLSRATAARMRRYAIVIIIIAAAVLTPPDVVSQVLLALPMWLLFECSLLFMRRD